MIKPKTHFLITGFFNLYIDWILKRHFQRIEFNKIAFNNNESILLLSNHFSWWDGFLLYHVNKTHFKKKFYIMVLDETMQKLSFLKYLGAFSVAKNSRQMIETLDYAAALLNDPDNMVVIFPQGKLYSNFVDDIKFEKGLFNIMNKATSKFQYVFAATFMENFNHKRAGVRMYLKSGTTVGLDVNNMQIAYQRHYHEAKKHQTTIIV